MIEVLIENPLLLLFLIAAIGYPLGRIKLGKSGLGIAAVLFVGLAFGAMHPDLKLPEIVYQLGLVLFVYTIGLSNGSLFIASLRHKGLRDNLLAGAALLFAAVLAGLAGVLFKLTPATTGGVYVGSLTNTPSLASILEYLKALPGTNEQILSEPVVAYSLTYPGSVIGMILVINILQRLWKVDFKREALADPDLRVSNEPIRNRTVKVAQPNVLGVPVKELIKSQSWNIVFGRVRQNGKLSLATGETVFHQGDLVNLIGSQTDLDMVTPLLGECSIDRLEEDLSEYDKQRIMISNVAVAGRHLRELGLFKRYGSIVTRIRRGDVEFLPHGDSILNLGDQVRVIAPPDQMEALCTLLGNSYQAASEIDILTFSLGLALGLVLGLVPFPVGPGLSIKLGIAGGPLIAALVFGAIGRTGHFVWTIPYSTNVTLRQVGLILFLAGIGTRSGYAFISTLTQGTGLLILILGFGVTCLTGLTVIWIGYKWLKIPMGKLAGIVAGIQTQPAVLGYAQEISRNDLPNIGYSTVYPLCTILKIIVGQLLVFIFMNH